MPVAGSVLAAGCAAPPWQAAPSPVTGSAIRAVLGTPGGDVVGQDVIGTR